MSVFDETIAQLNLAISSIISQKFTDFELIIILDKPDNIVLEEYLKDLSKNEKRIIFIKNSQNVKLGASLNKWIQISRWKYIARMDGDDQCHTSKIKKQFLFLEEKKHVDLLFTWWTEINEKRESLMRIPSKKDFRNIKKTFFYKSPILHASMMCRTEILQNNLYPETDRPEDFSLFLSLISKWYKFDVLEESLYTYYVDEYNLEKKYKKNRIFSSNFIKILSKNILYYYKNIFFWWMYWICLVQWILSRNKYVFYLFFNTLQSMYKKFFI